MRHGSRRSTPPPIKYVHNAQSEWTPERSAALDLISLVVQWKFPAAIMSWSVPQLENSGKTHADSPCSIQPPDSLIFQLAEETRQAFDAAYDGVDPRPHLPPPIVYWSDLLDCEVRAELSAAMFQHAHEVMKFRHTTPSAYTPK